MRGPLPSRFRPPALVLGLTLGNVLVLPVPAAAATSTGPAAEDSARARALYDDGRIAYEAGDYNQALAKWGDAYSLVSTAAENDGPRYELLYSIADAHHKSYALDADPSHLRKARDLLLKCQTAASEVFADDPAAVEAEQKRVRNLLDTVVDDMVDTTSPAQPSPRPPRDPNLSGTPPSIPAPAGAAPPPSSAPPHAVAPLEAAPPPNPAKAKAMFGAGLGVLGLGVAGLAVMISGMAVASGANDFSGADPNDLDARASQIDRGRLGNGLGVGGGIAASIGLPVGVALTIMGRKRMKRAGVAFTASSKLALLNVSGRF